MLCPVVTQAIHGLLAIAEKSVHVAEFQAQDLNVVVKG